MPRNRIPYILLITALLAVPLYYLRDDMDTEPIRKDRYWIAKSNNKKNYPVVFGGDSRIFRGISPDHFEAEFNGYEAYNYAYWSNGYGQVYLDGMEKKLDTTAEVQVLILGVSPHSLTSKAARCSHFRYEMGRSKEQVLQNLYFSKFQEIFAPYEALELYEKVNGNSKPNNYRITYHQNGWVESFWVKPDTSYSAQFYETIFTDNRVSEEVIEGMLEYVERWTRRGIYVAGFRPPTSYAIRKLEHELGGFMEEEFIDKFTGAGGIWIPVDNDEYQTFDGNHLDHHSAARISADLARYIMERIGQ